MNALGKWVVRFPKSVVAIWSVLFLILGYFAISLPSILEGDGFRTDGEYEQVQEQLVEKFDFPADTLFAVVEQGDRSEEDYTALLEKVVAEAEAQDVENIQSPLTDDAMREGDTAYVMLPFDEGDHDFAAIAEAIEAVDSGIVVTGQPIISEDINKASQSDLARAEAIGIPVAMIVLLVAFGTVVAALVPVLIGIVTVVATFGILTVLGGSMDLSIFMLNVVPMIGLALSIDFALLFINRYREEVLVQAKGDALITTVQTAGRSIIFSAICVFIGLGAMMIIEVDIFQTIAIGGMVVIAFAVLSSLTLLPAVLFLLGDRLNKWRVMKVKDQKGKNAWRKFAGGVMKRPVMITILALVALGIGILPVKDMELAIPGIDALPESFESRQAFETINDTFLTNGTPAYVIATRDGDWTDEDGLAAMKELTDVLAEEPLVDSVDSLYSVSELESAEQLGQLLASPQGEALAPAVEQFTSDGQLLVPVTLDAEENSTEAQQLMRDWSELEVDGMTLQFGGQPKFNQEIFDEIYDKVGLAVALILGSTYVILMVAFRSILIPLKAIIMNVIGLASTFGVLVWLFQGGHLGLAQSDIALVLPVLVFSLVFGLSMDYEVFLISRIQEFYEETGDNEYATVEGLASTSKIITAAALIMIAITGAFAFTGVVPVKQIGVGIAIAIFIDATVIRLLLVPSLMKLFGDWNWWLPFGLHKKKKPSWLKH